MNTSPVSSWPNGKKIAVSIKIMFEAWSEGKAPTYTVQHNTLKAGVADTASQVWATYGGRDGVWRLLRLLDKMQLPATFFTSGRCVELYPDAVKQIVRSGHDLAAHSYAQDQILANLTPDEQRVMIRRSIDMLQDFTGYKVTGWATPSMAFTPETSNLIAEAGLTWHTDVTYVSLPYRIRTPYGNIAGVPTSDFSDLRVLRADPQDFVSAYKGIFDYLEECEPLSLIVLLVHAQFGGRPIMTSALQETLRYFAKSPDVWFTRHDALAKWALESDRDELTYADRFFAGAASAAKVK